VVLTTAGRRDSARDVAAEDLSAEECRERRWQRTRSALHVSTPSMAIDGSLCLCEGVDTCTWLEAL
jgi:hypothetical protein